MEIESDVSELHVRIKQIRTKENEMTIAGTMKLAIKSCLSEMIYINDETP